VQTSLFSFRERTHRSARSLVQEARMDLHGLLAIAPTEKQICGQARIRWKSTQYRRPPGCVTSAYVSIYQRPSLAGGGPHLPGPTSAPAKHLTLPTPRSSSSRSSPHINTSINALFDTADSWERGKPTSNNTTDPLRRQRLLVYTRPASVTKS
jgi:hypothetical protein